jgi:hypothetical protein
MDRPDLTAPTWSPTRCLPGALLLLSITGWSAAAGAREPWSDERLVLRAGAVFMDIDSSFRVDSRSLGKGTTVDGEDDLGLDDDDRVFRAELDWRFAQRHRLSLGYYDLSRDAGTVTGEPIQIGNVTFPPGIEVRTDFDLRLADLSYSYSLIQNERLELAPLIGAPPNSVAMVHNVTVAVMQRRRLDLEEKAELSQAMDRAWNNLPRGYDWLKEWRCV